MQVASNFTTEISIPLYIIYVYDDNGTPPGKKYSINTQVDQANEVYEGFLDFYICGYHHINSTEYYHLITGTEKVGLYNTFHVDDAINVYIVKSIDNGFAKAKGDWPWNNAPNNNIWLNWDIESYVFAHEIGHYFGLFHTFSEDYFGPNNCRLKNPLTEDTDMVSDTPVDPGRTFGLCMQECPIATTSCTLSCYNSTQNPVTYTYVGYYTNNVMSYHNCPSKVITEGQKARMEYYLTTSDRSFLLTAQPTCNNNIAEYGSIRRACTASTQNLSTPVRDIMVDMKNLITNWEDSDVTLSQGRYHNFQNDYSNHVTVKIKPEKTHPLTKYIWIDPLPVVPYNYHPTNGVSSYDLALINKQILGITPLPTPYNWIAADANNSGSITTLDIIYLRKVILGLDYEYPAGTWRFVPEYLFKNTDFETAFMANPFGASYNGTGYPGYMDEITLDMDDDAVAEEASWSFQGIKVGDVDCNANIEQFTPPDDDDDKFSAILPGTSCVNTGEEILLTIQATSNQSILAYQMGIKYNETVLQFLGESPGNLPDFSYDNFGSKTGEIRTIWYKTNAQEENIATSKILFNLRFKARSGFCDISQVFEFDGNVLNNAFYGSSEYPVETDITLSYQVDNQTSALLSAYPNPALNSVSFDFQLAQSNTVEIRVSDYLGHQVTHTGQYSDGNHSYTFNSLASLSNGSLNYVIIIGSTVYSGVLVKSQQ